jgi:hypothetical protein
VGCARRRREALDLVPLTFRRITNRHEGCRFPGAGGAFERRHLIATRQNLLDGRALALVQVRVLARDRVARALRHELGMLTLAGTHPVDRLSLELHHRGRRDGPTWHAWLVLDLDEFASLNASVDLVPDVVDARVSERSLQRIAQDRPFLHDRLALQIAIAREGDGPLRKVRLPMLVLNSIGATVLRRFYDMRRLVTETVGEILVATLHLCVRHIELGLSRVVRRDLCRRRALSIRFGQVVRNLLAPWAGCVEVFARVPADFGLAALTTLNCVPKLGQARRQLGSIDGWRTAATDTTRGVVTGAPSRLLFRSG